MPAIAPSPTITIDSKQEIYLVHTKGGYSCVGFDVALDEVKRLGNIYDPALAEGLDTLRGSMEVMERRTQAFTLMRANPSKMPKLWMSANTKPGVKAMLETLSDHSSQSVRLFQGNPTSGLPWAEEHDVVGRIGRSQGPMRVPLLVTPGEQGGGAILTGHVLAIRNASSNEFLYKSDHFFLPPFKAVAEIFQPPKGKMYHFAVYQMDLADPSGFSLYARERTFKKARDLAEFMSGQARTKMDADEQPLLKEALHDVAAEWIQQNPAAVERWAQQLRDDGKTPAALTTFPEVSPARRRVGPR